MSQLTIMYLAALGASLYLVGPERTRLIAVAAAIVAGVAALISLGILHLSVPHLDLGIAIGLAALGGFLITRIDQKMRVVAATVITVIGAIGLLEALL